jgi:hypothetical protein
MNGGMIWQLTRAESWVGQLVENMIIVLGSTASQSKEITKTANREYHYTFSVRAWQLSLVR